MSYDFVVFDYGCGHICLHRGISETRSDGSSTAHALYYYFGNDYVIFSFSFSFPFTTELALYVFISKYDI